MSAARAQITLEEQHSAWDSLWKLLLKPRPTESYPTTPCVSREAGRMAGTVVESRPQAGSQPTWDELFDPAKP